MCTIAQRKYVFFESNSTFKLCKAGDLNSKSSSLTFFELSQSVCSSLLYSICPPPIFSPSNKVCQFCCGIGRGIFPRSLLGNTEPLQYMLLWYVAIWPPQLQTLYMIFLLKKLINSARSNVLQSWKKLCYNLWEFWNIIWAVSSNYCYLIFFWSWNILLC